MRFNRETEADRTAKDFAKRQVNKAVRNHGQKAAKAVGKAAGKATSVAAQKIAVMLAGVLGSPVGLVVLTAILVLIVLPSLIFGSGFGTDSKYDSDEIGATSVGPLWEDDAELAIEERYKDLKIANFWGDLGTFFTTGTWGQEGVRFETEYANACDADETGTDGYFSSSNRLIAIINEAFRLSLTRSRIVDEAKALAEQTVPEFRKEIEESSKYGKPSNIAQSDYIINISILPDPSFNEDQNFIYESCYVLAASSGNINNTAGFSSGVRSTLDQVFSLTGLDQNLDKEICWEASVSTNINTPKTETYTHHYEVVNSDGTVAIYQNYGDIPAYQQSQATAVVREKMTVNAEIYYMVNMAPNFHDIVNERYDIEVTLPSDAQAYEITQEEQVNNSALELAKFYGVIGGAWAEIGEAGLPLPRESYWISSEFGWRILKGERDYHEGVDLAASMGTPIYAVKDGVCTVHPFNAGGYGNYVTVDHGNGLMTRYAHMSSIATTNGKTVTAGEIIGYVGSTGNSTGPHLHFEVWSNGQRIDPLSTSLGSEIRNAAKR